MECGSKEIVRQDFGNRTKLNNSAELLEKHGIKTEDRQPCEVWSRCMGYHRPISHWNHGKKQEFADRQYFEVKDK